MPTPDWSLKGANRSKQIEKKKKIMTLFQTKEKFALPDQLYQFHHHWMRS